MKSLYFFDDWLLDVREGLEREMGQPRLLKKIYPEGHPDLTAARLMMIHPYEKNGCYAGYVDCHGSEGHRRFIVRVETDDPLDWPLPQVSEGSGQLWQRTKDVVLTQDGEAMWPSTYCLLNGAPQDHRGYYVATVTQYKNEKKQFFGFSDDGVHYQVKTDKPWRPYMSDTSNPVVWDPFRERYLVGYRPWLVDRRLAMGTTTDFEEVHDLGVILQPDSLDPPGTEFYGLGFNLYDDIFIGTISVYTTEPLERSRIKWEGCVEAHLAYSYDGDHWYRPFREPFMARREPGEGGEGSIYAGLAGIRTQDNRDLILAMGSLGDHNAYRDPGGTELYEQGTWWSQVLYDLRPDGCVYLKTRARWGHIRTRALLIEGEDLTLNTRTLPTGEVKLQALDPDGYEPIPGFTLEECVPITGDHLAAPVRWRERDGLGELKGKPVLLEVHVREGELYALRCDYRPYYAAYKEGQEGPERI